MTQSDPVGAPVTGDYWSWYSRLRTLLDGPGVDNDLAALLRLALEEACDLLHLETGWAYVLDVESGEPSLIARRSLPPAFDVQPERWEGFCGCVHALLDRDPDGTNVAVYRCSRLSNLKDDNPQQLSSHVCIPLMVHGVPAGIINIACADTAELDDEAARLLEIAGRILGLLVERAHLPELNYRRGTQAERERVARELHDTLLQGLTGITLQLETGDALMPTDPVRARGRLIRALEMAQATMAETRAAIDDLAALGLNGRSLAEALEHLGNEFVSDTGMALDLQAGIRPGGLPRQVETAVVRIVREGLMNVVRHSAATEVAVRLRQTRDRLSLIIEDNGKGFDAGKVAESMHGYGLASMRRRAQLLSGRFRLKTAPGKGTRVEISIPLGEGG